MARGKHRRCNKQSRTRIACVRTYKDISHTSPVMVKYEYYVNDGEKKKTTTTTSDNRRKRQKESWTLVQIRSLDSPNPTLGREKFFVSASLRWYRDTTSLNPAKKKIVSFENKTRRVTQDLTPISTISHDFVKHLT